MTAIDYRVNPPITNEALNTLFAAAWPDHRESDFTRVLQHSLTYIGAYEDARLIGFVNVAWDGGIHAFLLDTTVHRDYRRRGIGVQLVRTAMNTARAKGIKWLHVDYEPHLEQFYQACGFRPTLAGLANLHDQLTD